MLFLPFLVICLRTSFALLISTGNRISTRNLTCRHGLPSATITFLFNCEACLVSSRNYDVETKLSLTGSGPGGISYACLRVNEVEAYHENLRRECLYFPSDTLNGYDDFCIASPHNNNRGSYRACICITNVCNLNYPECIRQANPNRDEKSPLFSNTITELTDRIKCYRPYEDYNQQTYSKLTQLCPSNDEECKKYIFYHGVLCVISIDRKNQTVRQTLVPSIYSAYLIKYKTQLCNAFTSTSKSISFSQCRLEDTVCMCAVDECNKDLETCRASGGVYKNSYSVYFLLIFLLSVYFLK